MFAGVRSDMLTVFAACIDEGVRLDGDANAEYVKVMQEILSVPGVVSPVFALTQRTGIGT